MIEKRSRFLRRYEIRISPRAKSAFELPLVDAENSLSVMLALRHGIKAGRADMSQPNGDNVELIRVVHDDVSKVLTLLFHRASPNAADPAYRKKENGEMSLRLSKKQKEEVQAVSAHLVIKTSKHKDGFYSAALEEMPGLSFSVVQQVLRKSLTEFEYQYKDKRGKEQSTYSTLKAVGRKSESLATALKKGSVNHLVLARINVPDAPDSGGIAEPQIERIKYRIIGNTKSKAWLEKLSFFQKKIRAEGWDDVMLDLSLDDERHRTVKLERDTEAAEIMFVRSEQTFYGTDLDPCTLKENPDIIRQAAKLLAKN